MSIIKTLQAKIAEDAMTKAMMELRIREEVAEEMTEQINEIENMYRFVFSLYQLHVCSEVLWTKP